MHDALDCGGATGGGAGIVFAAIGAETVLEITEFAIGLAVVAQRRSAGLYRLGQNVADEGNKACHGFGGQIACGMSRVQACAVKHLTYIDISQTGDDMLIKQRGFNRRGAAFQAWVR